jgi:hypothetical protein
MKLRLFVLMALIVGFGLGLGYAWLVDPVTYTESSPAQVVSDYRQAWLTMAAEAYAQDGDWPRTQMRLDALRDPNLNQTLAALFERYSVQGPKPIAKALAQLADRLNGRTAAMNVYLATPIVTPTSTQTPSVAPTSTRTSTPIRPRPTATLTMTPRPSPTPIVLSSAYQLISRAAECVHPPAAPQIRVVIQDAAGRGVPGKEIWITWDSGADRFVTGLKPEVDPGYGDFDMALDQSYSISIDKPAIVVVTDLHADPCSGDGHLSWRLVFRQ